jgi:hypothetical protein
MDTKVRQGPHASFRRNWRLRTKLECANNLCDDIAVLIADSQNHPIMKSINTHLLSLFLISPLASAGELQPAQIPATAKWLVHANLEEMRDSEAGKQLFARVEADHGDGLRAFQRMFSLHPINDLTGITLFGNGQPEQAVALIAGKFDRGHIEDVLKGAEEYSTADHGDLLIHTWRDKGILQHAAFFNDTLLVFSRQEQNLKQSLAVLKAGGEGSTEDELFRASVGKPLLDMRGRIGDLTLPADAARVLGKLQGLRLTTSEEEERLVVRVTMEADSEANAGRIHRILDGLFAFAEMEHPELEAMDIKGEMDHTEGFPGVTIGVSAPVAGWISIIERIAASR